MSTGVASRTPAFGGPGALALGVALAAAAGLAWLSMLRGGASMSMPAPGASASLADGAAFTAQWGVMMAAMMLPSATPTILLYRMASRRLAAIGDRAAPAAAFAAVYLLLWLVTGIPVYGAYVAVGAVAARWPGLGAAAPYAIAAVLAAAGIYQLSGAKRVCLRRCESPLGFLMRRWRSGYAATLRLAARHAGYCIGCCWGLMVILVVAGAMSLPWVLAITLIVFTEKLLPQGWRTARVIGAGLIALALAVALRPELAGTMRGQMAPMADHPMSSAGMRAPR